MFNPFAPSNRHPQLATAYRHHETLKKRHYERRVREIEHASFTPLIFSLTGGLGPTATVFYKRLASRLSTKWDHPYASTMGWLRCRLWPTSSPSVISPYCEPPLCASEARAPPFTALEDVPPCPSTLSSKSRNCHIDYLGTYSLFDCIFHNFVFYKKIKIKKNIIIRARMYISAATPRRPAKKKKKKKKHIVCIWHCLTPPSKLGNGSGDKRKRLVPTATIVAVQSNRERARDVFTTLITRYGESLCYGRLPYTIDSIHVYIIYAYTKHFSYSLSQVRGSSRYSQDPTGIQYNYSHCCTCIIMRITPTTFIAQFGNSNGTSHPSRYLRVGSGNYLIMRAHAHETLRLRLIIALPTLCERHYNYIPADDSPPSIRVISLSEC